MKIFNDLLQAKDQPVSTPTKSPSTGLRKTPVKPLPAEEPSLDQVLPEEYALKSLKKSPTPSATSLPGARAPRRKLRGS